MQATAQSTLPSLQEPFSIGSVRIPNRLVLAPLAGIGNWFVRWQAKRYGAGLAVSEMVSSHAIAYRNRRTLAELLRIEERERCGGPGRRPDRPEHGLPGAEGLSQRRGRGAA